MHSAMSMVNAKSENRSVEIICKHIFRIIVYGMLIAAKIAWVTSSARIGFHQALSMLPISLFWILDICYIRNASRNKSRKELDCVAFILKNTVKMLLMVSLLLVDLKLEGGLKESEWAALMWPVRIAAIALLVTSIVMLGTFLSLLQNYCSRRKSNSGLQVLWSGFFFFNVLVLGGSIGSFSYYFPACMESRTMTSEAQICLTVFAIFCLVLLVVGLTAMGYIKCPEPQTSDGSPTSGQQTAINVQVNLQINLQIPQDVLVTFIPIYNFPKFVMKSGEMADVFKPATVDDVRKGLSLPQLQVKPKGKVLKLRSKQSEGPERGEQGPGNPLAKHLRNLSNQLMNLASSIEISTQGPLSPDNHRRSQTVNAAIQQETAAKESRHPQRHVKVQGDDSAPNDISMDRSIAQEHPHQPGKRLATEHSADLSKSLSNHSRQYSWANMPKLDVEANPVSNTKNVFGQENRLETSSCNVCFNKAPDSLFLPCGHAGLCTPCGQVIYETGKCCFCRKVKILMTTGDRNAVVVGSVRSRVGIRSRQVCSWTRTSAEHHESQKRSQTTDRRT